MRKLLTRTGAVLAASALPLLGLALPASAQSYLKVCNSTASVSRLRVYDNNGHEAIVALGNCATMYNANDEVRVDVDPEAWTMGIDVDSYYIGVIGSGYGPCHDGENSASNPPNNAPDGVRYNTNKSGC